MRKVSLIQVLLEVQRETGVPIELTLSETREGQIPDARRMTIKLLFDNGFKAEEISVIFNMTRANVYAAIKRQLELNRIYKANKEQFQNCERRLIA